MNNGGTSCKTCIKRMVGRILMLKSKDLLSRRMRLNLKATRSLGFHSRIRHGMAFFWTVILIATPPSMDEPNTTTYCSRSMEWLSTSSKYHIVLRPALEKGLTKHPWNRVCVVTWATETKLLIIFRRPIRGVKGNWKTPRTRKNIYCMAKRTSSLR